MKTAKEWHDELLGLMNRSNSFAYCSASTEDIEKIQADALRHCAAMLDAYSARCPMHAASAYTIARLIENEIAKLNKKEDA